MPPTTTVAAPPSPAEKPITIPASSERNISDVLSDVYSEIDSMDDTVVDPPKKTEPPKKQVEKSKQVEEPEIEEEPEQEEEKPKEAEEKKPEEEQEQLPKKTRDLKTVYLDLKKKYAEMEQRVSEREKKIAELEQRNPEEASVIMARLKAAEERAKQLDDEMKFVNYTKSTEFRDKYQKPYETAWAKAVSEISELTIEQADGSSRQATAQDLLQIANMPLGLARKTATELFGDAADDVMAHRRVIRELSDAQTKALEDAQKNAGEREKTKTIEQQAAQANRAKAWANANQFLESKFPKAFKVDETDADDKTAHKRGFALADLLYAGPGKLTPEQTEALPEMFKDAVRQQRPLNESELIKLHALARLKMANEPRLATKLKKANARIAELEKNLKAYERSEPPGGKSGKGPAKGTMSWQDEADAEIDALDS